MMETNHMVDVNRNTANGAGPRDGWAQVASVLNSAIESSSEVIFRMDVDNYEPLIIDLPSRTYYWSTPLTEFPAEGVFISLETHKVGTVEIDPRAEGGDLDALLWVLGINAYSDDAAPWINANDRFRLTQWPNLTRHFHNMHQMHMLAILGNAYFTAPELAVVANVTNAESQRLINALSLMRLLKRSEGVAAIEIPQEETVEKSASLFARLRARLGR
jgi:hypothetical protein